MKAIRFVKPELWLTAFLLLASVPAAFSQQQEPSASDTLRRLEQIDKRLAAAEEREKKILENQAVLLEEIRKTRSWLARR